jgi:hypothetical protein
MLLGIYVLGPWFITIEGTILGSGFHNVKSFSDWTILILLSLIPIYTFVMATYDVSLLGLLVVTAFLAVAHWKAESAGWVLPFGHLKLDAKGRVSES